MPTNFYPRLLLLLSILLITSLACSATSYTATPTPVPTNTPVPTATRTPIPTATLNLAATQQINEFRSLMQNYYDAEYISTVKGKYYLLDDYSDSLAQEGYYRWGTFDVNLVNFILRTHVTMSTANKPSAATACGIVFRTIEDFAETVIIQQNGEAHYTVGDQKFDAQYFGKISNPAELELVLIVNGKNIRLYVDEKEALTVESFLDPSGGRLGFAVVSGSNDDYGCQCSFTKSDLWATLKK